MTALPSPARTRWQPLRIGLIDLFHYDAEEFWFRDGRLLLRGNNGTGKSKVLALTLPFLLDGDLSARRVEPDGDPGKRMEWNLLLGGAHPHSERLGYTWIEFGRRDESGEEHFRTLLCGLKAVSGRGIARHWFAVTDQRIGSDLSLLDATGTALGRDRLADALTGRGTVYDQARAYRRAVDEALFRLGEQRYAALVDLLIQLRQPQLSKRPNEAALSRALTEALPPMDQAVVADAADAFRSLDEEKEELRAATEAERAASAFLDHYRRYARVAARRRARLPRQEHTRYEHLGRELAAAQGEKRTAEAEREDAAERLAEAEEAGTRLRAQDAALREGPEMRDARELVRAAEEEDRTREVRGRAEADRARAEQLRTRADGRLGAAENRLVAADEGLAAARSRAGASAQAARLEAPYVDESRQESPEPGLRRAAEESLERGRRAVAHVSALAEAAGHADTERRAAARRADEAASELSHTVQRQEDARTAVTEAGRALVTEVRDHLAGCVELPVPDVVGLLDRLQDWTDRLDGPYPAQTGTAAAHRTRAGELADEAAALAQRQARAEERRTGAASELAALEAGGQRGPEPPHTRTAGLRDRTPGAPLWRLVDFRDELGEAERAGLEAALEASGLLDAWVLPEGVALEADGHDVLLAPGGPAPTLPLSQALRPAVDHGDARAAAVGEHAVARLLTAVGLGEGTTAGGGTWVTTGGRFRIGGLTGRWAKRAPAYVGEGAREEARRIRIGELRDELHFLEEEMADLRERRDAVTARRATLDTELAALPEDAPLRQTHARAAAAADAAQRARTKRDECAVALTEAAEEAESAHAALHESAHDLGLPAAPEELAGVRQALADHEVALAAYWPALRERADAVRSVGDERAEAVEAAERAAELGRRVDEAAREAAGAEERHATLRATVGAAVAELERRLAETAEALRVCEREQRTAREAGAAADRRASRAEGRIEQLETDVTAAVAARKEAIGALQRFADTGLLAIALPEVEPPSTPEGEQWAATPAVALARTVESALQTVDDSDGAWERVQRKLSEELKSLQDALSRHGHSASARMVEDGIVVDIVYQGRERAVPELATALAGEVGELQRILSAHEREILETHLLTEVAGTLQDLIGAAERQVRAMNGELEERPTSTGMTLRLVWRPARRTGRRQGAPEGLVRIRDLLRQSADAWSDEDRARVGAFLQERIAEEAAEGTGSWLEHLTAALDYRAWHEFAVERHQQGRWVSATGPASGGERVLAVSVPLFAAASSHYATARHPHAPRLVTLDEAFAGVDDDSRAKCLGLLHAFDLDVVMTSEREWACYPQVPGVAIAQLSRVEELDAVLVTRWEWDGHARARAEEPGRPWEARQDAQDGLRA
ncbi:TIGR02680 family protein [Streptomyces sp. NPDC006992]|uniref:TIGR02680 family protein n=1 Tax=unclassified Streptomyces TaxID=2593676 RepID=UPI0033C3DF48